MNKIFFKNNLLNIIILILSLILALVPFVIAPVCPAMPNGSFMNCHYTGQLVMYLGILLSILGSIVIFINNKKIKVLVYSIIIVVSSAVHLIPHRIIKIQFSNNSMKHMPRFFGYCSKDSMQCITHNTFIISSSLAFTILLLALICIIFNLIKKRG